MKGILLDSSHDVVVSVRRDEGGKIVSGLVLDDITYQRCELVIMAQKGEFKEYPTLGFGIESYLKLPATRKQEFINALQTELKSDGFSNAKVTVNENDLSDFEVEI